MRNVLLVLAEDLGLYIHCGAGSGGVCASCSSSRILLGRSCLLVILEIQGIALPHVVHRALQRSCWRFIISLLLLVGLDLLLGVAILAHLAEDQLIARCRHDPIISGLDPIMLADHFPLSPLALAVMLYR